MHQRDEKLKVPELVWQKETNLKTTPFIFDRPLEPRHS